MLRRNFLLRVVAEIAGGLMVLGILWLAGGKEFIQKKVEEATRDWASFVVPSDALLIDSDISARNGIITICNSSGKKWLGGLVQITRGSFAGDYPTGEQEIGLLAELKRMDLGECVRIPLEEFTDPTWKRIPGPRSLQPTQIDLVVRFETAGHSSKSMKASTMDRSRPMSPQSQQSSSPLPQDPKAGKVWPASAPSPTPEKRRGPGKAGRR